MRIGYGYKRSDKSFAAWDCDRVFIDTPSTEREERRSLFLCLQPGDVLFMFTKGELGYGKELQQLRKILADNGVTIEYPPIAPDVRGRPKKFNLSDADADYIRILWKDQTFSVAYCLRKASERSGADVKRHHMLYKFGNRND